MLIIYDESIPKILLPIIQDRFKSIEAYFPPWAYEVVVEYVMDNAEDAALACRADYSYRFIKIMVFDQWFQEEDWEIVLFHELMHALFTPYTIRVERLIDSLVADESLKRYVMQELTDGEEAVAQDMAYLCRSLTKL